MLKTAFLALTLASALAITSNAYAADLIIDEPVMAGVVDVSGNWDGPFVGVFGGYDWVGYSEDNPFELDLEGWLLGVDAGVNFTVTDGIVAGLVGDIAWSNIEDENPAGYNAYVDWVGSLRGRIAFDGGAFLPYLTAGLAVAGVTVDDTNNSNGTDTGTHIGWTAGAGVEFAVSDSMSIDLLYRYSDYGTQTYNVGLADYDVSLTSSQVTVGLNLSF